MALQEASYRWNMGSTGASSQAYGPLRETASLTFHCVAGGSSVTIGLEAGRTSTSPFARMGSTAYSIDANQELVIQMPGPLGLVRPYLITGSTVTVELFAI